MTISGTSCKSKGSESSIFVIGISGGSGSGKTWCTQRLAEVLRDTHTVSIFDLDNYYLPLNEVSKLSCQHDNPAAINYRQAVKDLKRLKEGIPLSLPLYDYCTHEVIGHRQCLPSSIILVEGIFILADQALRHELDLKLWVDVDEKLRYERRIHRDLASRGRTKREIEAQYLRDVKPGYEQFIEPLKRYCDFSIFNQDGMDHDKCFEMIKSYVSC